MIHLGHSPDATTPQPGVLVAIPPAVDSSLDQAPLSTERGVQLGQRPSHCIAFRLVLQAISPVLFLGAACSRINAVLRLEFRRQFLVVDRLHVTADGVLHLDPVARILERNPLNAIRILPDDQGGGRRNRTWGSIGVHTRS